MIIKIISMTADGNTATTTVSGCRFKNGGDLAREIDNIIARSLGKNVVSVNSKIKYLYSDGESFFSMPSADMPYRFNKSSGRREFASFAPPDKSWPDASEIVYVDGTKAAGAKFSVEAFREGYLLTVGTTKKDYYLKHREVRIWVTPQREHGRCFVTLKELLKYLKANEEFFTYRRQLRGEILSIEPASVEFLHLCEEAEKGMSEKKHSALNADWQTVNDLLSRINGTGGERSPQEEAVRRMKSLGLMRETVQAFADKGTVQMSEAGILWELDTEAQKAVKDTTEYGLPYHVIKSRLADGAVMYSVLFVSDTRELWPEEQLDRKEGTIFANVWMPDFVSAEMGDIVVEPSMGGLVRIA